MNLFACNQQHAWNFPSVRPLQLTPHENPDGVRQAMSEDVVLLTIHGQIRGRYWVTHFIGGTSSAMWSYNGFTAWRHYAPGEREEEDNLEKLARAFGDVQMAIAHQDLLSAVDEAYTEAALKYSIQ